MRWLGSALGSARSEEGTQPFENRLGDTMPAAERDELVIEPSLRKLGGELPSELEGKHQVIRRMTLKDWQTAASVHALAPRA